MPTYEYQCRACGSTTEVIHSMLEEGPKVCERCGGSLRRILFPAGIIFKGSGFYRTDSRAEAKSSDAGTSAASSGSSDGAVSKPAAAEGSSASSGTDTGSAAPKPSPGTAGASSD